MDAGLAAVEPFSAPTRPTTIHLHPLTLQFDHQGIESDFRSDVVLHFLPQFRMATLVISVVQAGLSIPEGHARLRAAMMVETLIATLSLLAVGASFTRTARRHRMRLLLGYLGAIVGCFVIKACVMMHAKRTCLGKMALLGSALMVVILFALPTLLTHAAFLSAVVAISVVVPATVLHSKEGGTSVVQFAIFLLSLLILGVHHRYRQERTRRFEFILQRESNLRSSDHFDVFQFLPPPTAADTKLPSETSQAETSEENSEEMLTRTSEPNSVESVHVKRAQSGPPMSRLSFAELFHDYQPLCEAKAPNYKRRASMRPHVENLPPIHEKFKRSLSGPTSETVPL